MISIQRPPVVPQVLATRGRKLRDAHEAQHARQDLNFDFNRDVYGDADVKEALRTAQHDKCCFCESKVGHVAFGDVEHFRPKAAFRSDHGVPAKRPGYFWLAYEWTNLLYACEQCNRRNKANLFPLADENARARSPSDDLAGESPLFIDPSAEDPSLHIGFREEYPYAVGGSARGEATWRTLGLDRPELIERRREYLQQLRVLNDAAQLLRRRRGRAAVTLLREIERQLHRAVGDSAEYTAASRALLAGSVAGTSANAPARLAVGTRRRAGRRPASQS